MPEKKETNPTYRDQILKLTEGLGNLKGKVDQMDKNLTENVHALDNRVIAMHDSVKGVVEHHDDRINELEDKTAKIQGKAAGIALAVSLIVSVIGIAIAFWKGFF